MADAPSFRKFFSLNKVDDSPELLDDPKEYLVSLARNSRKRAVRDGVAEAANPGARPCNSPPKMARSSSAYQDPSRKEKTSSRAQAGMPQSLPLA